MQPEIAVEIERTIGFIGRGERQCAALAAIIGVGICGNRREPGKCRTSTRIWTWWHCRSSTNSAMVRVEWPIVQIGGGLVMMQISVLLLPREL